MVLATIFQTPKEFVFDAAGYWSIATDISHGINPYDSALLELRGAWTPLLYLPAALVARVAGSGAAGFAVIVENSLLIAVVGAVLIPRLVGLWRPVTPLAVYSSAALTWLILVRFAPYPLTDLWAVTLVLAVVVLLTASREAWLTTAGILAGIALNVRPAYLVSVFVLTLAVLWYQRWRGVWFGVGAAAALVPQVLVNLSNAQGWKPWPPATGGLTRLQAYLASFVVRYDTVAYVPTRPPSLFFCDPGMARAVGGNVPVTPGELASAYAHHPIAAAPFIVKKIGAALHWPVSAPYYSTTAIGNPLFAMLVTAVAVVGAISLARMGWRRRPSLPQAAAVAVWIGALATVATSVPETRFALLLVLLGIVGCVALIGQRAIANPGWLICATASAVLVFAAGVVGLHHAIPIGVAPTPAVCAAR